MKPAIKTKTWLCCLAAGTLILAGCASPWTAGTRIVSHPGVTITKNSRMVAKRLRVTDVDRGTTDNGFLKVQIEAENTTGEDWQLEYKFRWILPDGFEEKTMLSTWRTVRCDARDLVKMSGVAPNGRVTNFEFVVRFPDRW